MTVSAKRIAWTLVGLNALLILIHLASHYAVLHTDLSPFWRDVASRFNMDREVSVPTWFSQTMLIGAAALFAWTAVAAHRAKEWGVRAWAALAALFAYASMDEGSSLHELATEPVQNLFGVTSGPLFFAWVVPGLALFAVACLAFLRFFLRLPRDLQWIFGLAALCLLAAIGVEMVSGGYWQARDFQYDMGYRLLNALEEGLENTMTILVIYALLRRAAKASDAYPTLRITP